MRNTAWVHNLKGQHVTLTIPQWLAQRNEVAPTPAGIVGGVTEKAIGLWIDGELEWFPLSQVSHIEYRRSAS